MSRNPRTFTVIDLIAKLNKLDHKLGRAWGQNKLSQMSQHYTRMAELLDLVGRSNFIKEQLPVWVLWNKVSKIFKETELYEKH